MTRARWTSAKFVRNRLRIVSAEKVQRPKVVAKRLRLQQG